MFQRRVQTAYYSSRPLACADDRGTGSLRILVVVLLLRHGLTVEKVVSELDFITPVGF